MIKLEGIVEEVYIPKCNDKDIMHSTAIGFKIRTNEGLIIHEEEQNIENVKILREDKVIVKKQIIDNREFIDIEKIEGDIYG